MQKSAADSIDNPIPRPVPREELVCDTSKPYSSDDACFPLDGSRGQSWSLSEIFGHYIQGTCLASKTDEVTTESVCINVPHERDVYISQGSTEHKLPSGNSRCFILPASDGFQMLLPQQDLNFHNQLSQPPLYVERSFTGYGQERGGVQALLTNPSSTDAVEFIYLESLPWFMKPYLHTLKARIAGQNAHLKNIIKDMYYRPAVDRRRGTQLEIRMSVPAASTVTLTYDFDKAILRYTEYPPYARFPFIYKSPILANPIPTATQIAVSMSLQPSSVSFPLPQTPPAPSISAQRVSSSRSRLPISACLTMSSFLRARSLH